MGGRAVKKVIIAVLAYIGFRFIVNTTRELTFADTGEDRSHE